MISIIITTYNYEKFIERSLRSALDQSLAKNEFEVIVINDASTDNTKKILENYTDVAHIHNLKINKGLSGARNFGVKKARGQFIMFVDADDYIYKDMLLVQKTFLTLNTNIDAVSSDYYLVDEKGNHIKHIDAKKKPIACGIMFRKDYLIDIGLYDETFKAREEEDLRIRWSEKYNIHNIVLPLYRYRMHENNLTKNKKTMEAHKNLLNRKHKL